MRKICNKVLFALLLVSVSLLTLNQFSFANTLSPDVEAAFATGGSVRVIVRLKDQADVRGVAAGLPVKTDRKTRARAIIEALRNRADISQIDLDNYLKTEKSRGKVRKYQRFWIFNGFAIEATEEIIRAIASRNDVQAVNIDSTIYAPPLTGGALEAAANGSEWNISRIQAPDVWSLGYQGQGIVIGSLDSGVDVSHSDLSGSYRGGTNSWHDAVSGGPAPYDDNGHGTRTMGIAAGSNTGGTDIGVAPGVQWITCKMLDAGAYGYGSQVHECFQWIMDPDGNPNTDDAPHVVNNSWLSDNYCTEEFRTDIQALRTAGILPVFAIGNVGPGSGTADVPGGYSESFGTGATDSNNNIASFSSRGPSCWGEIKPDVSAPGVSVKSSNTGGGYATGNGTSFASPHVAGGAALLLSGDPTLTIDEIEACLENSALDLGTAGKDNTYGSGLIQLLSAVNLCVEVPDIAVSPSSFDFGVIDVGNQSGIQTFTITNSGTVNLIMGVLSINGTDASEFSILNDNCSNQAVVSSSSCTVDVVFSPSTGGVKNANISIPSNDPDTPVSYSALSGTGYHPDDDLDGDGMPNGWEVLNGLNPYDSGDAGLDGDLDGIFNVEEYVGQTDPSSALSVPAYQTIPDGSMNLIRLVTPPGVTVVSFSWTDPSTLPASGMSFQYGLTDIILSVTNPGDTATFSLTYAGTVTAGSLYGKYGPTSGDPADHWYTYPLGSNEGDRTIILTLTDGQDGDHNLLTDGLIEELGGAAMSDVKLGNISTRASVGTGNDRVIGGFIISGSTSKTVLLRSRGPSMSGAPFNISGTLTDPYMRLYSSSAGAYIAQNDNWGDQSDPLCGTSGYVCGTSTDITATGLDLCIPNPGQTSEPPGCNQESAILITLPPGSYTAVLSGVSSGTGVGLVEVFDVDDSSTAKLINISTRAKVLTGNNRMIGGFIIDAGAGNKQVLLRARGPSMSGAPFNITGTLSNPYLRLYSSTAGAYIAQNDNWGDQSDPLCGTSGFVCGTSTDISATGIDPCVPNPGQSTAPSGCSNESAMLITLTPGSYTAVVSGVSDVTGVGLVEVFEVE